MANKALLASIILSACSLGTVSGVEIAPAEIVQVKGEALRLSAAAPRSWSKGTKLKQIQHAGPGHGVPANRAIDPDSVVVRYGDRVLVRGKDYLLDPVWGSLGIGPESSVTTTDVVTVDYRFSLRRVDSLVRTASGKEYVRQGRSHLFSPEPPSLEPGETRVANLFADYFCNGANAETYPVTETPHQAQTATTPGRIPRTMAKIKAGRPVKIAAWGDSVTVGGDASDRERTAYVAVLRSRLKAKFSEADITVRTIAVGGSNSQQWLYPERYDDEKNPRVKQCQWKLIEEFQPDLVTIEFVNDAGLNTKKRFDPVYSEILNRVTGLSAEIIFITPHFTMPSMMGFKHLREQEKRGYVANLHRFSAEHNIALADASARWAHLWKEGIPYITLLRNGINHPDDRGHALFADELMKCFAE